MSMINEGMLIRLIALRKHMYKNTGINITANRITSMVKTETFVIPTKHNIDEYF